MQTAAQTPDLKQIHKNSHITPNIAAVLAYLVLPITGIIFLVTEKRNSFIKFHAIQSILFGIVVFAAIKIVETKLFILLLIGIILKPVISVSAFVLWLTLMWKSYNNEEWELPFIGKIAKDHVRN